MTNNFIIGWFFGISISGYIQYALSTNGYIKPYLHDFKYLNSSIIKRKLLLKFDKRCQNY